MTSADLSHNSGLTAFQRINTLQPINDSLQRLRSSTELTNETNQLAAEVLRNHQNLGIKVDDCIQDVKADALERCRMGGVHVALYIPRKANAEDEDNSEPTLIVSIIKHENDVGSFLQNNNNVGKKDYLKFGGREFTVGEDLSNNFETNVVAYTHGSSKYLKSRKYQFRSPFNELLAPPSKKRKSAPTSQPKRVITKKNSKKDIHLTSKVHDILSILSNENNSEYCFELIRQITNMCEDLPDNDDGMLSQQYSNSNASFGMNSTRNFEDDSDSTTTDEEYISDSSVDDLTEALFSEGVFTEDWDIFSLGS